MEEQTSTTGEMAQGISRAADATAGIATTIAGVAQFAAATSADVAASREAIADVARMSGNLRQLIDRFTY